MLLGFSARTDFSSLSIRRGLLWKKLNVLQMANYTPECGASLRTSSAALQVPGDGQTLQLSSGVGQEDPTSWG